jgi:hypothetical protein
MSNKKSEDKIETHGDGRLFVKPVIDKKVNGNNNSKKKVRTPLLTHLEKSQFQLSDHLQEILVGNLLGDAHMRKFNININSRSNARIRFLQSLEQADFIYHLYELFKEFTYTEPKTNSSLIKETGNIRHNIYFSTRSLPCFNEMYSLFYENKVKVVPSNIDELLTSVGLAY